MQTERERGAASSRVRNVDVADHARNARQACTSTRHDTHIVCRTVCEVGRERVGQPSRSKGKRRANLLLALLALSVRVVVVLRDCLPQLLDPGRARVLVDVSSRHLRQLGERDVVGTRRRAGNVANLRRAWPCKREHVSSASRRPVERTRRQGKCRERRTKLAHSGWPSLHPLAWARSLT